MGSGVVSCAVGVVSCAEALQARDGGKRLCYEHKRLRTGHLDTKLSFLGGKERSRGIISYKDH